MRLEGRDWEAYEIAERERMKRSFSALGADAFNAAVESAAHWNRMYREEVERQRNAIRETREKSNGSQKSE